MVLLSQSSKLHMKPIYPFEFYNYTRQFIFSTVYINSEWGYRIATQDILVYGQSVDRMVA